MTSVTLRHVSKRFDAADRSGKSGLASVVESTGRMFNRGKTIDYLNAKRAEPEPADRTYALDDVSLTIRDGETLALLGPSGSGKTTLLRVIAGLTEPDEGEVLYDKVPIRDIPLSERGLGIVFENYALYPHLDARSNIGFFDIVRRRHRTEVDARIEHVAQIMGVDIKHLLARKPPTLSGGEQQRVAVARALARDPKLFLFDEPLSNLDAKLRAETRVQIKRLLRHYQITAVYVTHDQTEAIAISERIAIIQAGRIIQVGTYQDVYYRPVNIFVATFLGNPPMNVFEGNAEGDHWQGTGFALRPLRPGLKPGQKVWFGIRPEHIIFEEEGIPVQVELVEPIYNDRVQIVYLSLIGQNCVARIPLEHSVEVGTTAYVRFPDEHIYFFDDETGQRLS